jgi:predicted CXXCH cytochrome family protein
MLRPLADAAVLADFGHAQEFLPTAGPSVRIGGGDRPYFEFPAEGAWKRFYIDFTIGSKWQQAYATRLGDGRILVFPVQYSAVEKRWLNYWAMIDPPGSTRAKVGEFSRLPADVSYERNCAVCHTSQLRLLRLDDQSMQHTTFREPGVNCETCHGPSARHAAGKPTDGLPPFRFARVDHVEATLICGQCHRQSALRELGPRGEMNFTAERPYFNRLAGQPYIEFGVRAFYKDGRFRETTFIGEAFMRSACFRRGTAQCASCHDPHPPDAAENRTSLKFRSNPDQMCLQCHDTIAADMAAHTRHPAGSQGSRCAACHMPPIMNSLLFKAASHQIDDIPQVDLTVRFGREQSPNACLICHSDQSTAWVARELAKWRRSTAPRP